MRFAPDSATKASMRLTSWENIARSIIEPRRERPSRSASVRPARPAGRSDSSPSFLSRIPRAASRLALEAPLLAGAAALSLAAPASALAQSPSTPVAPGTDAGRIERSLQAPPAPRATHKSPVFEGGRRLQRDRQGELSLILRSLAVEGSTVYADEELAPLYKERLGRKITLAEVFGIADAITAKYRNDGYILSRAVLPPQTIANGKVRIRVIEGYIDEVRIQGEVRGSRSLVEAYAAKLKGSRPLSIGTLERYLLLIEDLPGITSKAVVTPAKDTPGAADLVILVEDKAFDGFVRTDNRGTRFNGPVRLWLGAGLNSAMGVHERTAATFVTAGEGRTKLQYLDIGHERQIGTEGGKLHLKFTYANSEPGHTLRALNVLSRSQSFALRYAHPLTRSRAENLSLHADFVIRNSETTIFRNRLSMDRLRFIRLGALYDSADEFGGVNQIALDLYQGLRILGASKAGTTDLSREKGRPDFTRLLFSASRLQQLGTRWSLLGGFTSQFAASKLLASEEFGVGGERCGRAYDPSEVTGDHGACFLAELRYGRNFGATKGGYQLYGFYDAGAVWRHDAGALETSAYLSSAGIGLRFNFAAWLSGSVETAWPLIRKADSREIDVDSPRGFLSLAVRF